MAVLSRGPRASGGGALAVLSLAPAQAEAAPWPS